MKLEQLARIYEQYLDKNVTVRGWVLTKRAQKGLTFIKLTDGSNAGGIQLVCCDEYKFDLDKVNIGSSLMVDGILVKSPGKNQLYEMNVRNIKVYGLSDLDEYPLSKGKLPLDYLRNYPHLRTRTSTFGSVFRIKSAISFATHEFFKSRCYLHINPNIITTNECEGGAGTFKVTEYNLSDHKELPELKDSSKHDWNQDHFNKSVYLTVSSQLNLEALACSLGGVYTTNKSFRSEHSSTNKHLSEFEHLEVEDVFINLDELMQIGEDYIKYVGKYLLDNMMQDLTNLDSFISKGIINRIETITNAEFVRIKYKDAIKILKTASLSCEVIDGEDLSSEMENYLTTHFKSPVFVTHWPSKIKSFYMKQNEDLNSTKLSLRVDSLQEIQESQCDEESGQCFMYPLLCDNFDLLMPYKVGELIGGSMREDNLKTLLRMMKEKNVNPEPLEFYTDLRKFGTVPHGGFGLGLDRMCMMFTGMENIKDVVAFPVYYKNCNY